jgi:branched-chain amino acid transport system ATP-binding protein
MVAYMLELQGISCSYGKVRAVSEISMTVKQGELVTLIGANGAGKSTTLKAISGLLPTTTGKIVFDGDLISSASPQNILSRGIAHCPEGRRVFPQMTVQENLELGHYLRRDRPEIADDLEHIFDQFPILKERHQQMAGTLSGGEQQMLAIGRALMSRPKLVLFDEPSLGLAPNIIQQTFDIITGIRDQGVTVLMVEQNAYAALRLCDRSYLLESGQVTLEGSGKEMLENPYVKDAYLGG